MPKGDKTGPEGKGPRTGRKLGFCSGSNQAGYLNETEPRQRMGRGPRNGSGRGPRDGSRKRQGTSPGT